MSQSENNRRELKEILDQHGYELRGATVAPNNIPSQEQAEAEVLNTVNAFVNDKNKTPSRDSL
jgi:hypothetical protein